MFYKPNPFLMLAKY